MQSLKYTGRTLTIKNKHKFGISTRYTPSCPTIQYDVYPIVSDTTLIPHLLQYIQLRKELTLCADLKLHNCYCTCSSINSFLVYISGLICQNHQNYKAMNWKIQFFYNIYWLIWLRFEFLVRLTQVLYMSFDLFFFGCWVTWSISSWQKYYQSVFFPNLSDGLQKYFFCLSTEAWFSEK